MQKNLLIILSALATISVQAQEIPVPHSKTFSNEAGIFVQQNFTSTNADDIFMAGIQVKKWHNSHYGIRALAAYGNYSNTGILSTNRYTIIAPDTLVEKYHSTAINMGMIGVGVEAQRVFYKSIVLFAAMELRGGYGTGKLKEQIVTRYYTPDDQYENWKTTGTKDANLIYIAAAPVIGAKVQLRHINFGLEMTGINMSYKGLNVEGSPKDSYGIADLNIGDFTHRIFIHYRF